MWITYSILTVVYWLMRVLHSGSILSIITNHLNWNGIESIPQRSVTLQHFILPKFLHQPSPRLHPGTISINTQRQAYTAPGESEILDLDDNLYLGGLPENKLGLVFPTEVRYDKIGFQYCKGAYIPVSVEFLKEDQTIHFCYIITQ